MCASQRRWHRDSRRCRRRQQHKFRRNITAVIVDHQSAAPIAQEVLCMATTATGLVVKNDDRRVVFGVEVITTVSPQVYPTGYKRPLGLAVAGI